MKGFEQLRTLESSDCLNAAKALICVSYSEVRGYTEICRVIPKLQKSFILAVEKDIK